MQVAISSFIVLPPNPTPPNYLCGLNLGERVARADEQSHLGRHFDQGPRVLYPRHSGCGEPYPICSLQPGEGGAAGSRPRYCLLPGGWGAGGRRAGGLTASSLRGLCQLMSIPSPGRKGEVICILQEEGAQLSRLRPGGREGRGGHRRPVQPV